VNFYKIFTVAGGKIEAALEQQLQFNLLKVREGR